MTLLRRPWPARAAALGPCAALACGLLGGCALVSPVPLWELAKATGAVASAALPYGPSRATHTVYHPHPAFQALCIEFNPEVNLPDLVSALQLELQKHQVDSRLYDARIASDRCSVWLQYTAAVAWDIPTVGRQYRPYMSSASLALISSEGAILSSSQYEADTAFSMGKWSSTQSKLAPVVTALLTGVSS